MGGRAGVSGDHLSPAFCRKVESTKFKKCSTIEYKVSPIFWHHFGAKIRNGGPGFQSVRGNISGRSAAQNWNIATQFSTKLAQFFDTILNSKFAIGAGVSWAPPPTFCKKDEQHKI